MIVEWWGIYHKKGNARSHRGLGWTEPGLPGLPGTRLTPPTSRLDLFLLRASSATRPATVGGVAAAVRTDLNEPEEREMTLFREAILKKQGDVRGFSAERVQKALAFASSELDECWLNAQALSLHTSEGPSTPHTSASA